MAESAWTPRVDSVTDRQGKTHRLTISRYDNLDPPADDARPGPWDAFGLRARIEHPAGDINVWLACTLAQRDYFAGETGNGETTLLDVKEAEARSNAVREDFTIKVKLAFRSGQLLPGDEIHVRLDPELRVPPYGEHWRRALA
ncbi:hypothetical protein JXB37_06105 [candidate division WOR-3 bacterium]|nr:hypothetical protein [candidate division WOR-3 bacterium]